MTDSRVKDVSISVGAVGGRGKDERVLVDGHDIANSVRGFRMAARVGELTDLELDLMVDERYNLDGRSYVSLPQSTRDALVALGWTPPEHEPLGVRFWIKVSDQADVLDGIRYNGFGWTVLREVKVKEFMGRPHWWIFEVEDRNAPAEAAGLLLNPVMGTNADGSLFVSDYGISKATS